MSTKKVQPRSQPGKVLPMSLPKTRRRPEFFETTSWKSWSLEGILDHALHAWVYRDHEDVELRADVVLVLRALTRAVRRGDLEGLRRKGGPVRWARSYLSDVPNAPPAGAEPPEVLRWLVDQFEHSLREHERERGRDAHLDRWLQANAEAIATSFFARLVCLETVHAMPLVDRIAGVPSALHQDEAATTVARMRAEIMRLSGFEAIHESPRRTARLIVRALLVGAGLDPDDVKNAMRHVK